MNEFLQELTTVDWAVIGSTILTYAGVLFSVIFGCYKSYKVNKYNAEAAAYKAEVEKLKNENEKLKLEYEQSKISAQTEQEKLLKEIKQEFKKAIIDQSKADKAEKLEKTNLIHDSVKQAASKLSLDDLLEETEETK